MALGSILNNSVWWRIRRLIKDIRSLIHHNTSWKVFNLNPFVIILVTNHKEISDNMNCITNVSIHYVSIEFYFLFEFLFIKINLANMNYLLLHWGPQGSKQYSSSIKSQETTKNSISWQKTWKPFLLIDTVPNPILLSAKLWWQEVCLWKVFEGNKKKGQEVRKLYTKSDRQEVRQTERQRERQPDRQEDRHKKVRQTGGQTEMQ